MDKRKLFISILAGIMALVMVLGLIAGFTFKHFKHFRNYKACLKGALTGLGIIGAVILFFALMLFRATL